MRRMLFIDTMVAVFVNAIVFPVLLRAAGLPPPQAMLGPQGAVIDAALATACPVVLMTILMTLVLRARFAKQRPEGAEAPAWLSVVPSHILVRSIVLTLIALTVLLPLRLAMIRALGLLPMDHASHFKLNMFHGCLIGLAFMPIIFLATFSETRNSRSTSPL